MAKQRKVSKWFSESLPAEVSDSTLFKFKVTLAQDKQVEVDMRIDLDIDFALIQEQLMETPSIFAYWAALYSELRYHCAAFERMLRQKRGALTRQAIADATAAGVKLTDKQILSIIEADDELNRLESRLALAQKHTGKLYYMIEAIKMKSDNLRSLSGFARMEMEQTRQS